MKRKRQDDPELEELIAYAQRSLDLPWKLLEKTTPLALKGKKRADTEKRTIGAKNLDRARIAAEERQKYRDIILKLYEQRPELKRANRERLAREVQAVLARRGITRSTKTIKRALPPPKKS